VPKDPPHVPHSFGLPSLTPEQREARAATGAVSSWLTPEQREALRQFADGDSLRASPPAAEHHRQIAGVGRARGCVYPETQEVRDVRAALAQIRREQKTAQQKAADFEKGARREIAELQKRVTDRKESARREIANLEETARLYEVWLARETGWPMAAAPGPAAPAGPPPAPAAAAPAPAVPVEQDDPPGPQTEDPQQSDPTDWAAMTLVARARHALRGRHGPSGQPPEGYKFEAELTDVNKWLADNAPKLGIPAPAINRDSLRRALGLKK
jgi:hypothetical protein